MVGLLADVVGVAVNEADTDVAVQKGLQVLNEVGVQEIACLLECVGDLAVGESSVIGVHTEGLLGGGQVQEGLEVCRRRRVDVWMANVINASSAIGVIWPFDVVSTHVGCLGTDGLVGERGAIRGDAEFDLLQTSILHVQSKVHIVEDRVVDCFDAVCIVVRKERVVRCLDVLIDEAIEYAEEVEGEVFARAGTICDHLILVVEVFEEDRTVVAAVTFSEKIERGRLDLGV